MPGDEWRIRFAVDPPGDDEGSGVFTAVEDSDGNWQVFGPGTEPRPDPPDTDILARIDATVTDVTTAVQLCACGCRHAVNPGSASPFFASSRCQRLWHSRRTHDPDDVYRRRDAARVYAGADHHPVPLQEPDGSHQPTVPTPEPARPTAADRHPAAYRRWCDGCGEPVAPALTWQEPDGEPGDVCATGPGRLHCPDCGSELPGPAFTGTVTDRPGQLVLELHDGQSRIRTILPTAVIARREDPDGFIRTAWADMELRLGRFAHRFHNHRGHQR